MNNGSMIVSALVMVVLVILIAPSIIARNKGHILRNIALWVGIFLGLALFYQNFGPGKNQRISTEITPDDNETAAQIIDHSSINPRTSKNNQ